MPTTEWCYEPRGAYSLEATTARLVRYPETVDTFEKGVYARLLPVGRGSALVSVRQTGPPSRAKLHVSVSGAGLSPGAARAAGERVLERVLGTSLDFRAARRVLGGDPLVGPLLSRYRGLRVAGCADAFEAAFTAVCAQQVNLKLAYEIRRDFASAYGRRKRSGGREWIAFPTPGEAVLATHAALRKMRLSNAKAACLVGLSRAFASGELDDHALASVPDDEVIARLVTHKGVGPWTADIVLMRGLAREDAFPSADLGVIKYLAVELLGHATVATPSAMEEFARRWSPFRAVALTYAYAEIARRRGQ